MSELTKDDYSHCDYRFYGDKEKYPEFRNVTVSNMFGSSIINDEIFYKVDSANSFYYELRV